MAERRMFAKTIIDSDAFLEMPATAQMLYFHLAMRADDDGFINSPKRIMRMIGSGEDDLKLLIIKKFIIPFESGVVVIKHWKIHNYIRKDTYSETRYKREKATLRLDENSAYTESYPLPLQACYDSVDGTSTQDSIVQGSIVQDRITDLSSGDDGRVPFDYSSVVEAFNKTCVSLPHIRGLSDTRRKAIRKAASQVEEAGGFPALFGKVEASDFLTGRNGNWNGCGFDWILKPANLAKILEGNYDNRTGGTAQPDYTDPSRYENTGWEV